MPEYAINKALRNGERVGYEELHRPAMKSNSWWLQPTNFKNMLIKLDLSGLGG